MTIAGPHLRPRGDRPRFRLPACPLPPPFRPRVWAALLAIAGVLAAAAPVRAAIVRVGVERGAGRVVVGSSTDATFTDGDGTPLATVEAMTSIDATIADGRIVLNDGPAASTVWLDPGEDGLVYIGDRWYRGSVRLVPGSGGLLAVNHVDLEQYLYSVLGAEMGGDWPLEALKAQAVAARSFALFRQRRDARQPFDLGDTTTWQVYRGVSEEEPNTLAATLATAREVLVSGSQIVEAVYHASSGGHTENSEDIWDNPTPYLRGVPDYDLAEINPHRVWEETFSPAALGQRLGGVGRLQQIVVEERTAFGRVRSLRAIGDGGQRTFSGDRFQSLLALKSTRFNVEPELDAGDRPIAFRIRGSGFGHGVGMSQWGARVLAEEGYNYRQILGHYYRNTNLTRIETE